MQPAPPGLELSSDDTALLRSDEELSYLFRGDLASGSGQRDLDTTSSADGRTLDSPNSRQLRGNSQETALPGATEDPGSASPEAHRHPYPIRGRVVAPPAPDSYHQRTFAVPQSSTFSAPPSLETKAESGKQSRLLRTRAPLRKLAPLPATSPFISKSQAEGVEVWKPFPADSPLVLRSQPEGKGKGKGV